MVKFCRHQSLWALLIPTLSMITLLGVSCSDQSVADHDALTFALGVTKDVFYPWEGHVSISSLDAQPGTKWTADFDLRVDLRPLKPFRDIVEEISVVIVGEPVYDANGKTCGMTATTVSSLFTSAGIPVSFYEGVMPVGAFGNRRASLFEGLKTFPPSFGETRLQGSIEIDLPLDIPHAWYRPIVDIFVRLKDSETPVDIGHMGYQTNQWINDMAQRAGPSGWWRALAGVEAREPYEFMHYAQVLPEIKVGDPKAPRMAWTIFHDIDAYGQSGLLPQEDAGQVGLLNRVRFPTPFLLYPGRYQIHPGVPALFPEISLADLFIGDETVPTMIMNYMDFESGGAKAILTKPDGEKLNLGVRDMVGFSPSGPRLDRAGFPLELRQTGEYELEMTGEIFDKFGRRFSGGGAYKFTVAMPLTFSTPVKPGTNYLVGSRFPAAAHVNPAVPADIVIEVDYYPNSDSDRARRATFTGQSDRFGHFVPKGAAPMVFDEPGEYRSLITARYRQSSGVLWYGAQTSAGIIAPVESEIELHGGRTYLQPPNPDLPDYGGFERYESGVEGGSSLFEKETMCQFDYIFPYFKSDTLFIATTYPFESVVGIVHSMELKSKELARRFVQSINPQKRRFDFPITPKRRKTIFLPDIFKWSEDSFAYFRVNEKHADHLPILWSNKKGLSPFLFRDDNEFEAYTYVSVIRPGFPVLSLAFAGSFQGPCWIVSPNPYGGQINTSTNGDLPGDLYRVMSGLVLKDKVTGKNYYDAYTASIVVLPPGSYRNSVSKPGRHAMAWLNGREQKYFIGMDTSESYLVGDKMVLGGTVMPTVPADVRFTVTKPDGIVEIVEGRSNALGGFGPPRIIDVDQPGVYRVKAHIEGDGGSGDIMGTGDGEFYNFAVPPGSQQIMTINLPPFSEVPPESDIVVPIQWPDELRQAKLTWSIMMPGSVMDEGSVLVAGSEHIYRYSRENFAIQYPFVDTVDYATGHKIAVDTIVMVFFLEAQNASGKKVYDLARVILRGRKLFNARGIFAEGAGHMTGDTHSLSMVNPAAPPPPMSAMK